MKSKKSVVMVFRTLCFALMLGSLFSFTAFSEENVVRVKTSGTWDYELAMEVLELVNQNRAAQGSAALTMSYDLQKAAMERAAELAVFFSHTRPNGESDSYLGAPDYRWVMCNLGKGYGSPAAAVEGWMNSTGHRNNILYAGHDWVGAGCCQGTDGRYYWVIVYYREGGYYPDYPTPES